MVETLREVITMDECHRYTHFYVLKRERGREGGRKGKNGADMFSGWETATVETSGFWSEVSVQRTNWTGFLPKNNLQQSQTN